MTAEIRLTKALDAADIHAGAGCVPNCGHSTAYHDNLVRDIQTVEWQIRHDIFGYDMEVWEAVQLDHAEAIGALCEVCRDEIEPGHRLCVPCGYDTAEEAPVGAWK